MCNLKKIKSATYLLPHEGGRRMQGLVIATEALVGEADM